MKIRFGKLFFVAATTLMTSLLCEAQDLKWEAMGNTASASFSIDKDNIYTLNNNVKKRSFRDNPSSDQWVGAKTDLEMDDNDVLEVYFRDNRETSSLTAYGCKNDAGHDSYELIWYFLVGYVNFAGEESFVQVYFKRFQSDSMWDNYKSWNGYFLRNSANSSTKWYGGNWPDKVQVTLKGSNLQLSCGQGSMSVNDCKQVTYAVFNTIPQCSISWISSISNLVVSQLLKEVDKYKEAGNYVDAAVCVENAVKSGSVGYFAGYEYQATVFAEGNLWKSAIKAISKAIEWGEANNVPSDRIEECYLNRAKYKLNVNDASLLDDLKHAGTKGEIMLDEISDYTGSGAGSTVGQPTAQGQQSYAGSGSGILISNRGFVVTNYHVIEGHSVYDVYLRTADGVKSYASKVVVVDKTNDLCLLQINDDKFVSSGKKVPFGLYTSTLDVGTSIFAMGYPLTSYMGEEVKLTDGLISSKTGYQGDIVTYQISAPIQPGNSGGPLFDKKGNLVGITNAGIQSAQNVGYAIKSSYVRNLLDSAPVDIIVPESSSIADKGFTAIIKDLTPFIACIKVR